jgi:hypothetical protein
LPPKLLRQVPYRLAVGLSAREISFLFTNQHSLLFSKIKKVYLSTFKIHIDFFCKVKIRYNCFN